MSNSEKGFTLVELLVVVGILAAMTLISLPNIRQWFDNARYREAAREIAYTLKRARSSAVSKNRQYQVEMRTDGNRYRVLQGNRPNNSNNWPTPDEGPDWQVLPETVTLRRSTACSEGNVDMFFMPDGTVRSSGNIGIICIMEGNDPTAQRFLVRVTPLLTGRVIVE